MLCCGVLVVAQVCVSFERCTYLPLRQLHPLGELPQLLLVVLVQLRRLRHVAHSVVPLLHLLVDARPPHVRLHTPLVALQCLRAVVGGLVVLLQLLARGGTVVVDDAVQLLVLGVQREDLRVAVLCVGVVPALEQLVRLGLQALVLARRLEGLRGLRVVGVALQRLAEVLDRRRQVAGTAVQHGLATEGEGGGVLCVLCVSLHWRREEEEEKITNVGLHCIHGGWTAEAPSGPSQRSQARCR